MGYLPPSPSIWATKPLLFLLSCFLNPNDVARVARRCRHVPLHSMVKLGRSVVSSLIPKKNGVTVLSIDDFTLAVTNLGHRPQRILFLHNAIGGKISKLMQHQSFQ
jgi:hypothetical protein